MKQYRVQIFLSLLKNLFKRKYNLHIILRMPIAIQIFPFLVGIAIVIMPFNNLPYFRDILHEMANEAPFYPLTAGLMIWLVYLVNKKRFLIIPKNKIFFLLCLFVIWVFISTIFNLSNISNAFFKERTGIEKNLLQNGLFLYMCIISFFIYNVFNNKNETVFEYVRKAVLISFLIVGFYSIFEILAILGVTGKNIFSPIEPLIHDYSGSYNRLRSVSGEPSYFAMYCAFVFPFMLSYLYDEKYNKIRWLFYILTGYFLLLILLTYSRTAYFIIVAEFLFFYIFIFLIGEKNLKKYAIKSALILLIVIVIEVIVLSFFQTGGYSTKKTLATVPLLGTAQVPTPFTASNNIRFASQVAALNIALKNPIFGVGLGQYGFHFSEFISGVDKNNKNEEARVAIQSFIKDNPSTPWPPVYSLFMRIAAELGFVGLILWLSIWLFITIELYKKIMINTRVTENVDWFGISLLACTIGALSVMYVHDSFRYFGCWIILGLTFLYIDRSKFTEK